MEGWNLPEHNITQGGYIYAGAEIGVRPGGGISENELNGTKGLAEGLRLHRGGMDGGSTKERGGKVTN